MSVKLKWVQHFCDKGTGKDRYYFRRVGHPTVSLGSDPTTAEFLTRYLECCQASGPSQLRTQLAVEKTTLEAISDFQKTTEYIKLAPSSKEQYEITLREIGRRIGHIPVVDVQKSHIYELIKRGGYSSHKSKTMLGMARRLFEAEVEAETIQHNPSAGLRPPQHVSMSHYTWTENDIIAFRSVWVSGSRERLQLELFLNTAQRCSDVCKMRWSSLREGRLVVNQVKTKRFNPPALLIPILHDLQKELDLIPDEAPAFVTNRYGSPLSAQALSKEGDRLSK